MNICMPFFSDKWQDLVDLYINLFKCEEHCIGSIFIVVLENAPIYGNHSTLSLHKIVPIHKLGSKYKLSHYIVVIAFVKLFGKLLESKLSTLTKTPQHRVLIKTGFCPSYKIVDHILALHVLRKKFKSNEKALFCSFINFRLLLILQLVSSYGKGCKSFDYHQIFQHLWPRYTILFRSRPTIFFKNC